MSKKLGLSWILKQENRICLYIFSSKLNNPSNIFYGEQSRKDLAPLDPKLYQGLCVEIECCGLILNHLVTPLQLTFIQYIKSSQLSYKTPETLSKDTLGLCMDFISVAYESSKCGLKSAYESSIHYVYKMRGEGVKNAYFFQKKNFALLTHCFSPTFVNKV